MSDEITDQHEVEEEIEHADKLPAKYDGVKWPGKIAYSGEIRGHYAGCRLASFQTAEEVNDFFEQTPHVICVNLFTTATGIFALYTTALNADELDDLAAWGREQRQYMVERQAMRDQTKLDAQAAERAEKLELKRLAELGRRHESNCGKGEKKKGKK